MSLQTILTATVLLAACGSGSTAEPSRLRLVQAAPPQPVCTTIYQPVCGLDRNRRQQTYSNECLARAAGATNIYPGTCVADITND
jgi:hypothetical protein